MPRASNLLDMSQSESLSEEFTARALIDSYTFQWFNSRTCLLVSKTSLIEKRALRNISYHRYRD